MWDVEFGNASAADAVPLASQRRKELHISMPLMSQIVILFNFVLSYVQEVGLLLSIPDVNTLTSISIVCCSVGCRSVFDYDFETESAPER